MDKHTGSVIKPQKLAALVTSTFACPSPDNLASLPENRIFSPRRPRPCCTPYAPALNPQPLPPSRSKHEPVVVGTLDLRAWVQHPHTFLCLCSSHTRAPCLHVMPCSSSLCALCDRHALQRELQHPTSLPQETATVNSDPCGIAAAAAEDCGSVAPAYLRVSNLPPPDSFDFLESFHISLFCLLTRSLYRWTTWSIFLAVGRQPEQRQLDSGDEHTATPLT